MACISAVIVIMQHCQFDASEYEFLETCRSISTKRGRPEVILSGWQDIKIQTLSLSLHARTDTHGYTQTEKTVRTQEREIMLSKMPKEVLTSIKQFCWL